MILKQKIFFNLAYFIGLIYIKTWRIKRVNNEEFDNFRKLGKSPVAVSWHDSLLPVAFCHRNNNIAAIASDSKDGELISFILKKWGYAVARGSSTRGGIKAALRLIKLCKNSNAAAAITIDGPKGPRHKAKEGAVFIAKNLDNTIFVVTIKADKYIQFKSWDKFILPKPFAKIEVHYSSAFVVKREKEEHIVKEETKQLEKYMIQRTQEVDNKFL